MNFAAFEKLPRDARKAWLKVLDRVPYLMPGIATAAEMRRAVQRAELSESEAEAFCIHFPDGFFGVIQPDEDHQNQRPYVAFPVGLAAGDHSSRQHVYL